VLHSGVVLAQGGTIVWAYSDQASLTMRTFSDAFLDHYLESVGDRVLLSVGCYQLEGPGIQLFEKIEGDYFTILGLPLLPLLHELRLRGAALP
jgi:septum formation protein